MLRPFENIVEGASKVPTCVLSLSHVNWHPHYCRNLRVCVSLLPTRGRKNGSDAYGWQWGNRSRSFCVFRRLRKMEFATHLDGK